MVAINHAVTALMISKAGPLVVGYALLSAFSKSMCSCTGRP
jgi:hypothetical protein